MDEIEEEELENIKGVVERVLAERLKMLRILPIANF
jgi:hypothetical protein